MAKPKASWRPEKYFTWLVIIAGLVGLFSATYITVEYINSLKNPAFVPVCNLNPIFSCSSVMKSRQAHAFGIPNELIGIAGYSIVLAAGIARLAGGQFKRWAWLTFNTGVGLATAFLTWLQFQTLYRIGALCLFCMIVWAVTIPLFVYTTLYNLHAGNLKPGSHGQKLANFALRHHLDIVVVWFLIIIALILKRFWYYFGNI